MKILSINLYEHKDKKEKDRLLAKDLEFLTDFFYKTHTEINERIMHYKGNEHRLFRVITALKNYQYLMLHETKDEAVTLPIILAINVIEAVSKERSNEQRFVKFIKKGLSTEQKIELLSSYIFSEIYDFGKGHGVMRHVMFDARLGKRTDDEIQYIDPEFCSTSGSGSICDCQEWLRHQSTRTVNSFIESLAKNLYTLRSAMVHEGSAPSFVFLDSEIPKDAASYSHEVIDAVTVARGKHMSFGSGLRKNVLLKIVKDGLWSRVIDTKYF